MTIATNLPKRNPNRIVAVSWAEKRKQIKAKFVPTEPKDGEVLLMVERPQTGPYTFHEYGKGDLITQYAEVPVSYVVLRVKPGYTRSGEGWKKWEQLLVARVATDRDHQALESQRAVHAAESQAIMDRMMSS